jgi:hypothetical protein
MFMGFGVGDEPDFVRLEYFGAGLETELVLGLLKSHGIPAVMAGRHDYANQLPHRGVVMVPRERVTEANQLLRDTRGPSEEPPKIRMPWFLRILFATPLILLAWNVLRGSGMWGQMLEWFR